MDTPAPTQTPSTSKLPTILLVVSALGLFATTALLGYQNYQLQSQISSLESKIPSKPIPTPTPSVTPTSAPTLSTSDSWIEYKNEKYGYYVKYPPKWSQSSESESNQSNTYFLNVVDDLNPSFGGLDQTQILVVASSDTLKYPKISSLHDLGIKKYTNISGTLYSWESVTEGNKVKVDRKGYDFVAKSGSYKILFRLFSTPEKEKSDQLVFEQLLNSFKLNNQENKFCGGIAGIACPNGFTCKLDGTYPDAGGTCEVTK